MQYTFDDLSVKMGRRELLGGIAAALVALNGGAAAAEAAPLVAVAASGERAVEEIASAWRQATGSSVKLLYGASGNLVRQIQQGLPAELFLSADESFALRLAQAGLAQDSGVVYASGQLALLVPRHSAISLDPQFQGLKAGWEQVRKFAIANPELAPYGLAAREVLQAVGLWPQAQARLVLGENIAQALQFVATGAADAGLSALSLLHGAELPQVRYLAVPDRLHAPLRQRMVLLRNAGAVATAFYRHLQSEPARAVLRRHGFGTP